jgi:ATP/maltotriose-dependent transcriptional regulator MalT
VNGLINAALSSRVGLVFGGPGSGKSVAIAHTVAGLQGTILRSSVTSSGADLYAFAAILAATVGESAPAILSSIEGACAEARKAPDPVASLSYWLGAHLRAFEGLVVVEDLHHAWVADARCSALLVQLVSGTKEACRWLISARTACELPVSSWVTYGIAGMPVEAPQLAFTFDELGSLAEALEARSADLQSIITLTNGWPAAATFALMTAARGSGESVEMATREMMYGFLAEQVLAGLPSVDVDFMMETCVFGSLDHELLRAAGIPNALGRIDALRARVAFLQPATQNQYRYHDLFRDFLLARLERDDERYRNAWVSAAQAYETSADFESAISAYRKIEDAANVRRILCEHGGGLIDRGRIDVVWNALETLDTHADGTLLGLRACCAAARAEFDRSDTWFELALELVRDPSERAQLAWRYASDLLQRDPRRVLTVLGAYAENPPADPRLATLTQSALALAQLVSGNLASARATMARAVGSSVRVDDLYTRALLQHQAGFVALHSGETALAERAFRRALEMAQGHNLHAITGRAQSMLYQIDFDRDHVSDAVWWARQVERSASLAGNVGLTFQGLAGQYDLEVDRWNVTAIERLDGVLEQYDGMFFPYTSQAIAPALALRAAMSGGFAQAFAILDGSAASQPGSQRRALRYAEIAVYAAAAARRPEAEAAVRAAQQSLNELVDAPSAKREARTHAMLTLAGILLGRESSADRHLRRLERLAPQVGPRFIALGRALRALYICSQTNSLWDDLAASLTALTEAGFEGLSRLINALPLTRPTTVSTFGALTKTELRVVLAMTEITTTRGLADALEMSENTVKFHLKAINRKLGCRTRHDVVKIAREQGIVASD